MKEGKGNTVEDYSNTSVAVTLIYNSIPTRLVEVETPPLADVLFAKESSIKCGVTAGESGLARLFLIKVAFLDLTLQKIVPTVCFDCSTFTIRAYKSDSTIYITLFLTSLV